QGKPCQRYEETGKRNDGKPCAADMLAGRDTEHREQRGVDGQEVIAGRDALFADLLGRIHIQLVLLKKMVMKTRAVGSLRIADERLCRWPGIRGSHNKGSRGFRDAGLTAN